MSKVHISNFHEPSICVPWAHGFPLISRLWIHSSGVTWSIDTGNFLVYGIQSLLPELQALGINLICCGLWLVNVFSLCLCVWFSLFSYKVLCYKCQRHDWTLRCVGHCSVSCVYSACLSYHGAKLRWNQRWRQHSQKLQHRLGLQCAFQPQARASDSVSDSFWKHQHPAVPSLRMVVTCGHFLHKLSLISMSVWILYKVN